ncbi:FG-GAP-like repeat-containing protein [Hymenobacter cellulosilyticus]|uniref:T9SS type A sorting domain-containing protein n=1 Tax=Hymenobacter cellulosilyticus TaxID=2932248 RepID=A0A8T9Q815_9BACT|nr:FG-GAP-like repeat-containing protein [Hymenobacter cellulosilyticus]UOQ73707.1 T9SS type A sorting domain-containing protein [Hymenobacter cellulosilyticus]
MVCGPADVEGDGDQDALVINYDVEGTVDLLRNDGNGGFVRSVALRLGGELSNMATADMDADGDLDLLITNIRNSTVTLARNDGQGAFSVVSTFLALGMPRVVVPADVNGDGAPDVVVSCQGTDQVLVALNNGTGQLTLSATLTTGREPIGVTTGDIDTDGDLDVLVANISSGSVSTWLNNAAGPTLSTKAGQEAARLQLAPNPAHQAARVQVPTGTTQVQIFSSLGQLVHSQAVGAGQAEVTVPLAGLPAGVYLVRAGQAVARLVVE